MFRKLAAVLTLALVLAASLAWPPRSASAQQPRPGLGSSAAVPAGRPVDLKLPPGYTLIAIRGGEAEDDSSSGCAFASEDTRAAPACRYLRGLFTVTLVLQYDPATTAPGAPTNAGACRPDTITWSGWVLPSESGGAQNIMIPIDACVSADGSALPVLVLPPPPAGGGTVELTLGGYCLNLSRDIPEDGDIFLPGVITDDPILRSILAAIQGKNLARFASWLVIQDAVWEYTDDDGVTPESLEKIAQLP